MIKNRTFAALIVSSALLASCGDGSQGDSSNGDETQENIENTGVELLNATPEEFAQTLTLSCKEGDVETFRSLAIVKEDLLAEFDAKVENDSIRKQLIAGVEGNSAVWEELNFSDENFEELLKLGSRKGVKWDLVEYEGFDYKINDNAGYKGADGTIRFSSEGKKFEFLVISCYEVKGKWYGMGVRVMESQDINE